MAGNHSGRARWEDDDESTTVDLSTKNSRTGTANKQGTGPSEEEDRSRSPRDDHRCDCGYRCC